MVPAARGSAAVSGGCAQRAAVAAASPGVAAPTVRRPLRPFPASLRRRPPLALPSACECGQWAVRGGDASAGVSSGWVVASCG